MCASRKFDPGFLLERLYELDEVAFIIRSGGEEVYVVRHDAVGMNQEFARFGAFSKTGNDPSNKARIDAEGSAAGETEREKIKAAAKIARCGKPDVFAFESGRGHGFRGRMLHGIRT